MRCKLNYIFTFLSGYNIQTIGSMTERDPGENHLFRGDWPNVERKVKNYALGNAVAWEEIQPILESSVEDYPEKYKPYLGPLEKIFGIRRSMYLGMIADGEARREIIRVQGGMSEEADQAIITINRLLERFFERTVPPRKFSRRSNED